MESVASMLSGESKNVECKEGYSKIRNEALATAFAYMRLIEHWGSGIPRIIGAVHEAGLREPEFLGGDTDLRINIYRQCAAEVRDTASDIPGVASEVRDTASEVRDTVKTTDAERVLLRYVRETGAITSAVAQGLLSLRERQTQKILIGLVNRGLLQRVGAARSTRYVPTGANGSDRGRR